jgi:PAS domain S-box-containing protein
MKTRPKPKSSRRRPSAKAQPAPKRRIRPSRRRTTGSREGLSRAHLDKLRLLQAQLQEAQETLEAIRTGEVDAVVVTGAKGSQVYSLAGAEQPYRVYVEQMKEGAVTISAEGVILYCNSRFAEMIGQPLERVISSALLHYLSSEAWIEIARVFRDGMQSVKHESELRCTGHRVLPVNLTASRLPLEGQDVMCLVVTDLMMQKEQAELQLAKEVAEKANVAKDAFLAALSHELRTPLTPVLLSVGALENDRSFSAPLRQQFSMMRRNVELEARLIDDLLDLTRIARGKLALQTGDVDFRDVLSLAIDICRPEIDAKQQRFEVKVSATETKTIGDGVRLQQAIWNLIRNASKFTPPGGSLSVHMSNPAPGALAVTVRDTGVGFDPKSSAKLFEAFEQGGKHITRRFGGLGLGLAITKSIVDAHGGRVWAVSAGADRGATFTLEVPLKPCTGQECPDVREPAAAPGQESGLRILFVEDHRDTRLSMEMLLRRQNHSVAAASTAQEALELASREKFDVVLSDLGLPDMSGIELMQQLRDRFGLRGVALTGFGMEEDVVRSRAAGFTHHITKPIRLDQLRRVLRDFVASSAVDGVNGANANGSGANGSDGSNGANGQREKDKGPAPSERVTQSHSPRGA